jgi:hypothetical protein
MSNRRFVDLFDRTTSRRRFLREGGLAAVFAGVATACKQESAKAPAAAQTSPPASGQTGGTMGPHDTSSGAAALAAAESMDAMHEKASRPFRQRRLVSETRCCNRASRTA